MHFWKRYWTLIRSFKKMVYLSVFWIAVTTAMGLITPYMTKLVFDMISLWAMPESGDHAKTVQQILAHMPERNSMQWLTVCLLVLMVLTELVSGMSGLMKQRIWLKMNLAMSERIPIFALSHLLKLSIGFHVRENTSKQITRVERGVNAATKFTDQFFGRVLPEVVVIPVYLIALMFIEWRVGVIALTMGLVVGAWSWYDFRHLAPYRRKVEGLHQAATAAIYEAITNVATVQACGREEHERSRISKVLADVMVMEWIQWARTMTGGYARETLTTITNAFVILVGVWGMSQQTMTLGTLVMLMMVNSKFIHASRAVSREWLNIGREQESLTHLFDLLETKPTITSSLDAVQLEAVEGEIEFRDVTFAYGGNGPAVSNISFRVNPGEMVALVGPSGSGKTTLVSLLTRAYDPCQGAILIDGHDLRDVNLESFRAQLGIVQQQVEIFSVSIADNIAYGKPGATQDEIEAAATLAGAHGFIMDKPDGYQTQVGERGLNLSGGERQRIGIARAILRDPRILIFDEATASLDVISEKQIQDALETLRQGRTTIVIAHRFSTIQSSDRVLVMQKGKLVAQGTQSELREGNSLFQELERLQSTDALRT
jgi:ABC-type multidrug transport system fused ATPase/permease subunit